MRKFVINVNGNSYEVEVDEVTEGAAPAAAPKSRPAPAAAAPAAKAAPAKPAPAKEAPAAAASVSAGQEVVDSPMPGNIWKVLVSEGDTVKAGDTLIILEAMKMENELVSPKDGTVSKILVSEGSSVDTGDQLVIVE